jgi:isoquinoline 1-oxidoreductase beta subunit
VQLPDGTELPYTELAATAAGLEPVTDVTLRDPSQWRLIGKPMERMDIVGKSTGTLDYGIDLSVEGMVHAAVRVNPRKGGTLNGYDATRRAMRGVQDVVEVTGGVAVIADNTWRAFRALDAITYEWGPAPYPAEQEDHWRLLSESFTDDHLDRVWRDDGDVDAGSRRVDEVIEAEYRSPYVAHAPLEPLNAIVSVPKAASRSGPAIRSSASSGRGGPDHRPRRRAGDLPQPVHRRQLRPSAGVRAFIKQATEIANQMRGTPVKLTYSREEDFAQDFTRHIAMGRGRGRVENGQVTAIDVAIAAPSVIASQVSRIGMSVPGPDAQIAAGAWNNPYAMPDFRMRAFRAEGLAPSSSWRAVGAPGAGFIFDTFLDELIHAAGADPMAERIRLIDHDVSRRVLETAAEISDWGAPLSPIRARGSPSSKASASRWPRSCRSPTRSGHKDRQGLGRLRRGHHHRPGEFREPGTGWASFSA